MNKKTRGVFIIFRIVGFLLFIYSLFLSPYSNNDKYYEEIQNSHLDSKKYYEIREKYITNKYIFQDYGITLMLLGFLNLLISKDGFHIKSPSTKFGFLLVGILAVAFTFLDFGSYYIISFYREEFPPWADSMLIPLIGVLTITFFAMIFMLLNLIALFGEFSVSRDIRFKEFKGSNYWYLAMMILSFVWILCAIFLGQYFMLISALLWLYFFASMWSGRKSYEKA